MQVLIRINQAKSYNEYLDEFEKIFWIISTFFSNVMIFTNAAGFLYLFKQISDSKNNKNSKLKKL